MKLQKGGASILNKCQKYLRSSPYFAPHFNTWIRDSMLFSSCPWKQGSPCVSPKYDLVLVMSSDLFWWYLCIIRAPHNQELGRRLLSSFLSCIIATFSVLRFCYSLAIKCLTYVFVLEFCLFCLSDTSLFLSLCFIVWIDGDMRKDGFCFCLYYFVMFIGFM